MWDYIMTLKIKKQIIDKYLQVINEYFLLMDNSLIMKELNYPASCLLIGINSIHRVFEYILLKTQSIENAYYYSQKAYFLYLEYMEQILKSNISLNLNHMDAVLFVYKKTIFSNTDESASIDNIMTLQNYTIKIDETELKPLFVQISMIINTLLFWSNNIFTFDERKKICDLFLPRFLSMNIISHNKNIKRTQNVNSDSIFKLQPELDLTISYLEIIQQKMEIQYIIYENLLKEILTKFEKMKKTRTIFLNESVTPNTMPEIVCA